MRMLVLALALLPRQEAKLEARNVEAGGVAIHRAGQAQPIVVQNARPDTRPWIQVEGTFLPGRIVPERIYREGFPRGKSYREGFPPIW